MTALLEPSAPHHARCSPNPDELSAILDPAITLPVWDRQEAPPVGSLDGFDTIHLTTAVAGVRAALSAAFAGHDADAPPPASWHAAIIADVASLAASFAGIMSLSHVTVRLERVTGDACRRWHADYVAVRLICTYCGSGTQWIDRSHEGANTAAPDSWRSLGTGAVGLFKGRVLAGDCAILHRSPPIAGTGEERLLLVIDAPPPADVAAIWERAIQHG